jgi:hypothetical protein
MAALVAFGRRESGVEAPFLRLHFAGYKSAASFPKAVESADMLSAAFRVSDWNAREALDRILAGKPGRDSEAWSDSGYTQQQSGTDGFRGGRVCTHFQYGFSC